MENLSFINQEDVIGELKKLIQVENDISTKVEKGVLEISKSLPNKKKLAIETITEAVKGKYAILALNQLMQKINLLDKTNIAEIINSNQINVGEEVERRITEIIEINFNSLPQKEQKSIHLKLNALDKFSDDILSNNY